MTDKGADAVAEITPAWAAVMEVLHSAYDLGMSGDPVGTTDPEQIKRRVRVVDACEDMRRHLDAIVAERDALRAEVARMRAVVDGAVDLWVLGTKAARDALFAAVAAHMADDAATAPPDGDDG